PISSRSASASARSSPDVRAQWRHNPSEAMSRALAPQVSDRRQSLVGDLASHAPDQRPIRDQDPSAAIREPIARYPRSEGSTIIDATDECDAGDGIRVSSTPARVGLEPGTDGIVRCPEEKDPVART